MSSWRLHPTLPILLRCLMAAQAITMTDLARILGLCGAYKINIFSEELIRDIIRFAKSLETEADRNFGGIYAPRAFELFERGICRYIPFGWHSLLYNKLRQATYRMGELEDWHYIYYFTDMKSEDPILHMREIFEIGSVSATRIVHLAKKFNWPVAVLVRSLAWQTAHYRYRELNTGFQVPFKRAERCWLLACDLLEHLKKNRLLTFALARDVCFNVWNIRLIEVWPADYLGWCISRDVDCNTLMDWNDLVKKALNSWATVKVARPWSSNP